MIGYVYVRQVDNMETMMALMRSITPLTALTSTYYTNVNITDNHNAFFGTMCTVSRVIMHIHLICMFVYFDRVITLNTGDPHVCHKKVKPRYVIMLIAKNY